MKIHMVIGTDKNIPMEIKSTLKIQMDFGTNTNTIPMEKKSTMKIQMEFGVNTNTILRVTKSTLKIHLEELKIIDQSKVVKARVVEIEGKKVQTN
jgi:hypothetical protein